MNATNAVLDVDDLSVVIANKMEDDEDYVQALNDPLAANMPPRTQRCWLLPTPGQLFSIHYCWNGHQRTGNRRGAGLFCELSIDGVVVERAFLPLKPGSNTNGRLEREWEIPGKFFRASDNSSMQLPFRFGVRKIDPNVAHPPETGIIRVVLYWARHNDNVPNLFPPLTAARALSIASILCMPSSDPALQLCVDLGDPEPIGSPGERYESRTCGQP
ncbi:hypothetical protein RSAG8_09738, partial [Rhizoctonia solani AG-8 WAC10335]